MKTAYKDMFPHDFDRAKERNSIAFLPIWALERHWYHNALWLDCLKPEKILNLVAEKIWWVVFPSLYLWYDLYPHLDIKLKPNKAYDCYHIEPELYNDLIRWYVLRMKHIWFQRVFILSWHYPNKTILEETCKNLSDNKEGFQVSVHTEVDFVPNQEGDHAWKRETSLLMATHPTHVDLSLMEWKENRLLWVKWEDPSLSDKKRWEEMINLIVSNICDYL